MFQLGVRTRHELCVHLTFSAVGVKRDIQIAEIAASGDSRLTVLAYDLDPGDAAVELEIVCGRGCTHVFAPIFRKHKGLTVRKIVPTGDRAHCDFRCAGIVCQLSCQFNELYGRTSVVKIQMGVFGAFTYRLPASADRRVAGNQIIARI